MPDFPKPPFVLLEDSKTPNRADAGLLFEAPKAVLTCNKLVAVPETIGKIERWQKKGLFLAGWLSYECAFAFHPTLKKTRRKTSAEPLIWMGAFEPPQILTARDLENLFSAAKAYFPQAGFVKDTQPEEDFATYIKALEKIKNYIAAGDVYQINHTFRMGLKASGSVWPLYASLRKSQPVPYGGLIDTGSWRVLSFSPELFIQRTGRELVSRPMKGTASIGKDAVETNKRAKALSKDKKNRAENLMITDLIRNDFSRVSEPGTVGVEDMFRVERFGSVLQMTSDVCGTLKGSATFPEIFEALFPCGSITGTPKIRAMEIIDETERAPRGVYTGALGFLAPGGDFTFCVPIRTLVLDEAGAGWMGIGSGVVADSDIGQEYKECLLKADFLFAESEDFALIETMLWEPETGFADLQEHFARLEKSAAFFRFEINQEEIQKTLQDLTHSLPPKPQRVRLLCDRGGNFTVEHAPLENRTKGPVKIRLAAARTNSRNPFLYHKTTSRKLYDAEKKKAGPEIYDVIFRNEKGEITEGTFNNIFLDCGDKTLLTPKTGSGILPGIFRQRLIAEGRARETSLTCEDLKKAKGIYLGNSVTGLVQVNACD